MGNNGNLILRFQQRSRKFPKFFSCLHIVCGNCDLLNTFFCIRVNKCDPYPLISCLLKKTVGFCKTGGRNKNGIRIFKNCLFQYPVLSLHIILFLRSHDFNIHICLLRRHLNALDQRRPEIISAVHHFWNVNQGKTILSFCSVFMIIYRYRRKYQAEKQCHSNPFSILFHHSPSCCPGIVIVAVVPSPGLLS